MKSVYLVSQRLMLATSMLLLVTLSAVAQAPTPAAPAAPKLDSGDTAWMLTSVALVLMMTVPGLALFYGGMVRKMNVLATVMQSFAVTCLVTVLWMVIGYSFAFTSGSPFLGGTSRGGCAACRTASWWRAASSMSSGGRWLSRSGRGCLTPCRRANRSPGSSGIEAE